jgi:adenine-specific DNA glycosylase
MLRKLRSTLCIESVDATPSCTLCPLKQFCSYYNIAVYQYEIGYPKIEVAFSTNLPSFMSDSMNTVDIDHDDW